MYVTSLMSQLVVDALASGNQHLRDLQAVREAQAIQTSPFATSVAMQAALFTIRLLPIRKVFHLELGDDGVPRLVFP